MLLYSIFVATLDNITQCCNCYIWLQDLFSYHSDESVNLTHSMLECGCDGSGTNLEEYESSVPCLLPGIEELMHWQHLGPDIEPAILQVNFECPHCNPILLRLVTHKITI
jgi:hypothetical protein